jgi:predicted amidohydrolase
MVTVATFALNGTFDKEVSLKNHLACIDQAADAGADLVVLPEVSLQGYASALARDGQPAVLAAAYAGAESVPDGPSVVAIAEHAKARGVYVIYGLTERVAEPGILYNTMVLTGPDGHVGSYRKVHVGITERLVWQRGSDWPVFDTPLGRIGMLICYDKAWPESCRELTLRGAELLVMSTAWSMGPGEQNFADSLFIEQYGLYERVRAAENTRWFISSNFAGTFGDLHFFGLSQIIDPTGRIVATTGTTDEQSMALATIDVTGGITDAYAGFSGARLLRDRRPETYTTIAVRPNT